MLGPAGHAIVAVIKGCTVVCTEWFYDGERLIGRMDAPVAACADQLAAMKALTLG